MFRVFHSCSSFLVLRSSLLCVLASFALCVEKTNAQPIPAFPEPGLILYGTITNISSGQGSRLTNGIIEWGFRQEGTSHEVVVTANLVDINGVHSYFIEVPFQGSSPGLVSVTNKLVLHQTGTNFYRTNVFINSRPATITDSDSNRFGTYTFGPSDRGAFERVDLQIAPAGEAETYEAWSTRIFGNPNVDRNADPDGDGSSNGQEFAAGTNPLVKDGVSGPSLQIQFTNNSALLSWDSDPGKIYRVFHSASLPVATNLWIPLPGDVVADSGRSQKFDLTHIGVRMRFYRIAAVDTLIPVLNIQHASGVISLTWDSQVGKTYRIRYSTNVTADASSWSALPGDVAADTAQSSKTDTPTGVSKRFYRVDVLP